MPIRKGEAPKHLKAELNFSSPAEKFTVAVTFRNHTSKHYREHLAKLVMGELVLELVDSWDADYPLTVEGIGDFEDEHPGICEGLIQGWWDLRRVKLEGN